MSVTSEVEKVYGPRKLLVEMQGGGETNKTGTMTKAVLDWTNLASPTNADLTKPLSLGLIQTNAWRRLQEQVLAKASVASASGNGFVGCVGTIVFDYISARLEHFNGIKLQKSDNWDTAIIAYCEDKSTPVKDGPIILQIDQSRVVYTTFNLLANSLIARGIHDPTAFGGIYKTFSGKPIEV